MLAECILGWGKQHGTMLNLIAYNLVSIPKLIAA
jgi:hypothetical protein